MHPFRIALTTTPHKHHSHRRMSLERLERREFMCGSPLTMYPTVDLHAAFADTAAHIAPGLARSGLLTAETVFTMTPNVQLQTAFSGSTALIDPGLGQSGLLTEGLPDRHPERPQARTSAGAVDAVFGQSEIADAIDKAQFLTVLQQKLDSVGDDAQLANCDLQQSLQNQQQTLQMLSTISQMVNDTSMAMTRKIGS
jgi:hypothetical protein